MFDLATHASFMVVYLCSMFLLFFKKIKNKKNLGERYMNFIFSFLGIQILLVFLPDILVHCALIGYAYI